MSAPFWLARAWQYRGVTETPGKATTPVIARWLRDLQAWWKDDETPWCGVFVATVMRESNLPLPRHWYRARAWLEWGLTIKFPAQGAVVVYERAGGGHVGFVVGTDQSGRILTLGGNQGNAVTVAPFDKTRVLGYRWPVSAPLPTRSAPVYTSGAPSSVDEA